MACRCCTFPICILRGKVGKAYFQEIVRLGNELQPDLVALT